MTTIDTNNTEPSLEWCTGCQRPAELCECDRTPNGTVTALPRQARTEPEPDTAPPARTARAEHQGAAGQSGANAVDGTGGHDRANGSRPNGRAVDKSADGDWTRDGHSPADAVDTGRTDTAEQTSEPRSMRERTGRWMAEWGALIPIWFLAGLLGAAGFAVSFFTVEHQMRPYFNELAWLVPTATDLGIVVFTLLDILLARRGMRISWLRYIPWALAACTIYLNVTAYAALVAQVAHAVLPALWIVFSEAVAKIMKRKAKAESIGTAEIPAVRWLCAPVATLILWRAMRLWDIDTYSEALELEETRQLAKAVMREKFGAVRKAPGTLRVRYRQRKITLTEVYEAAADVARRGTGAGASTPRPVPVVQPIGQASTRVQSPPTRKARPVQSDRRGAKAGQRTAEASNAPGGQASKRAALAAAWADFQAEGVADPTVRELAERASCSTGLAGEFKKDLKRKER